MVTLKTVVLCIYILYICIHMDFPGVVCPLSLQRGSDGVDRMVCCLTLRRSSPLSPICLSNHTPRCREKGREGGSEKTPADWGSEMRRKKKTGKGNEERTARREGGRFELEEWQQCGFDQIWTAFVLRAWKSLVKHLFSPLMAHNDFLRVISIPCPAAVSSQVTGT